MSKEEMINWIDGASYEDLLRKWRYAPSGSPFFEGEVGDYYKQKMIERKEQVGHAGAVAASKRIGWDG